MRYIFQLNDRNVEVKRVIQKPVFQNEEIIRFQLWVDGINTNGGATIIHYSDHTTTLDSLGIPKAYRDVGLSNIIMQKVIEEIDSKGNIGLLSLAAVKSEVPKLQHLYQKYGYYPCGNLECLKTDNKIGEKERFCSIPFIRESRKFPKGSKEYQEAFESWCKGKFLK